MSSPACRMARRRIVPPPSAGQFFHFPRPNLRGFPEGQEAYMARHHRGIFRNPARRPERAAPPPGPPAWRCEPLKPRRENENVHSLQQIRNIVPAAQQADASPPFRTLRLLSDLFLLFPAASRQHQKGIRVQAQERLKNAQQKLMVLGPGKVARVACHQFSLPAHFPSDPLTGFRRITEFSRINGVPDHHGILHSLAAKEPAAAPIHCT